MLGSPVGISRSFAWVVGAPCQYQKHLTNDESGGAGARFRDTISTTPFYRAGMFVNWRKAARLPIHLAHSLKDARAVVVHALGPSLQGSRQDCGEPCRL